MIEFSDNPRVIKQTKIKGTFGVPIGIRFLSKEVGEFSDHVFVSTVCLDDAHLEDPLKIVEAETGFETTVFLNGCTFFSVHTVKYFTKAQARNGHDNIVKQIMHGTLPLSIPLGKYWAHEQENKAA